MQPHAHPPQPSSRRRWLLGTLASGLLSACAQVPQAPQQAPPDPNTPAQRWSGRLALQVLDDSEKSWHAGFTLQGNPDLGELTLYNPLGNTLGVLSWTSLQATLRHGSELRHSHSLQALVQQLTGSQLPVTALFDWLHGQPTPHPGWEVDLQHLASGRLSAIREQPAPRTVLRLVLDQ